MPLTPLLSTVGTDLRPRNALARIEALDLARFLAVVGMMSAHLSTFGQPSWASFLTTGLPSTLFAVLAGMSAVLSTRRYTDDGQHLAAAIALGVRGLVVLLAGLALDRLPTGIMIVLPYLGTSLICVAVLLRVRTRWLAALASVLWIAGPHLSALTRQSMELTSDSGSSGLAAVAPPGFLTKIFLGGAYPVVTWLVYVLAGVVLARGLRTATDQERETRFALVLAVAGATLLAVATVVSTVYTRMEVTPRLADEMTGPLTSSSDAGAHGGGAPVWDQILTAEPHSGTMLDIARTLGFAGLVIGALLLLVTRLGARTRTALRPLVVAGAIPLTAYTLHVVAHSIAWGPILQSMSTSAGYGDPSSPPWYAEGPGILAVHVGGFVLLAVLLMVLRRRGPLESVVSWLSRAGAGLRVRRGAVG